MAAPHVAGVLARYRQANPTATVAQVRAAVQAAAVDVEAPGRDDTTGHGLLDAYRLLTGQASPPRTVVSAPSQPTALRVTAGDRSVAVTWGAPASTGGSPVTGYVVRAVSAQHQAEIRLGAGARSGTVGGLVAGAAYRVSVTASNAAWPGTPAVAPPVTPWAPAVPGAPAIRGTSAQDGAVLVQWWAAADNRSAVTGYTVQVYRGAALVRTLTAPGSATSLLVGGLPNGTAHTFTVTARNAVGAGPTARSAAVAPRTVPGAPRIGAVSLRGRSAVVRWSAPAGNGGAAITGYEVRVYRGNALVGRVPVGPGSGSTTVGGLARRVGYSFAVVASNAAGTGSPSGRSAVVRPR
jgi:hypothetical protein